MSLRAVGASEMNISTSHEQPQAVDAIVAGTTRDVVPVGETWDLAELPRNDAAWAQAKAALAGRIPELGGLQVNFGRAAEALLAALTADLRSDQDLRDAQGPELKRELEAFWRVFKDCLPL